jgi:hypothetical protein
VAYWAKLNENNIVVDVVITSDDTPDKGHSWLLENFGGKWVEVDVTAERSSSGSACGGIGDTYDEIEDTFKSPEALDDMGE